MPHSCPAATITWNGAASGGTWDATNTNWNTATTDPWTTGNGPSNTATFDTAGLTLTVNAATTNGITFSQAATLSGGTLTLAGAAPTISGGAIINSVLAGSVGFAKAGIGTTLTLTGTNTYTGTTSIAPGGTLSISQDANLGTAPASAALGSLVIDGNAIDGNGVLATTASFTLNANRGIRIGPSSGIGAGTINVATDTVLTYGGIISSNGTGTGGLTKAGAGTLVLSGANTYTGATTISAGVLKVGGTSAIPSGSLKGDVIVNATLDLNANSITVNGLSGTSGVITTSATGAISLTAGGNNKGGSFTGTIENGSGTLAFTKIGSGTLTLGGINTFTGGVTINAGTLQLGHANGLGAATNSVTFGPSSPNPTKLQLNGHSVTIGSLATHATPGTVFVENAGASAATLTVNQTTPTTFAGSLQNGGGGSLALTKSGTGTLTLTGNNTFTGTATISAGTLALSGGAAIADSTAVSLNNISGATLLLNANEVIGSLAGGGTAGGNVNLQSFTLTTGGADSSTSYSGPISGSGSLVKSGTGTFTLSGNNTFTGTATVSAGTLALTGGSAIADGTAVLLANTAGAILQLNANEAIGALAGGGTTGGNVNLQSFTLTTGGADSSSAYSGTISGTGSLVKSGTGTLTLSGTNSYSGTTIINAGTLSVGALNNLGTSAVTLGGGTLSYTGNTAAYSRALSITTSGGGIDTTTNGQTLNITTGAFATAGAFTVGGSGNTAIASNITGAGSLIKTGLGTLTLSGVNAYVGITHIKNGTLALGIDSTGLPAATALTLGDTTANTNGVLKLDGHSQTLGNLMIVGNGTGNRVVGGHASTLSTLTLNTALFAGILGGSGTNENNLALAKSGTGTLTLSGNNTFTGGVVINAGVVQLGGTGALNSAAPNSVTFGASAPATTKLQLNGNSVTIGALATNATPGTVAVENANATAATLTISQSSSSTFAGVLLDGTGGGVLALTKAGTGALTLSGNNTFTGGTSIKNGSIILSGDNDRLLATGTVVLGDTSTTGKLVLGEGTARNQTLAGLTSTGSGGNVVGSNTATDSLLTLNIASSNTFAGTLGGGGTNENKLALSKSGAGTLTLTGTNTYTGGTTITAGTININSTASLGASSGALTFNGAGTTLQLGANVTGSTRNITLTSAGIVDTNGFSLSTSGVFSGSGAGGLTKSGAGNLTLSGSNTYSGGTTVKNGRLILSGGNDRLATGYSVTLGDTLTSGKLVLGDAAAVSNQTLAGLTTTGLGGSVVGGNATNHSVLTLNIASTGSFAGKLGGTGPVENNLALVKSGAGTLTLTGTNTYAGGTTITGGMININSATSLGAGNLTFNGSSTTLQLAATIASSNRAIVLTSDGTIDTYTFNFTTSGSISGAGNFTKSGTGTLTLSGANTYTGTTTVSGGTLALSGGSAIADTSAVSIAATATLLLNASETIGSLASSGSVNLQSYTLTTGGATADTTYSGVISGTGGLTKTGTSKWTLSGSNTYAGTTTISTGTIALGVVTALPSGASKGNVIVNGTLDINGLSPTINGLTGSGLILNNGATAKTISVGSNDQTSTFSGIIQDGTGTIGLTKVGTGTLTVSNANTYSGGTTLTLGTLKIGNTAAIPSGTGKGNVTLTAGTLDLNGNSITINGLSGAGGISSGVAGNMVLSVGANDQSSSYTGIISNDKATSLGFTKVGTQTLTISGASTYSGDTTISAGTLKLNGTAAIPSGTSKGNLAIASGAFLDMSNRSQTINGLTGTGTITTSVANAVTLTAGGNNQTSTFDGNIQNGTGTITLAKTGTGSLTLTGNNTFTGGVTIGTGGVLKIGSAGAINSTGVNVVTFASAATAATKLQLNGNSITIAGLQTNATSAGSPIAENANAVPATLTINNSTNSTYASAINDGGGVLSLVKTGLGTQILTGTSNYSGGTTISGGILSINKDAALGATSGQLTIGAGKLQATASIASSLRNIALTDAASTIVVNPTFTYTEAGVISGSGTLNKEGTGIFQVSGAANTYGGGTVVTAGLLDVIATSGTPLGQDVNTNNITVNPTGLTGGNLSLSSTNNKGTNQTITVTSSASALGGIGFSNTGLSQAQLTGMFIDNTGSTGGVLSVNTTYNTVGNELDLSAFGNGKWHLGAAGAGAYALNTLTVGLNNTYRLGGGGGTLTLSKSNVLTGDSNEVLVGSGMTNGNGTVVISLAQNYGDSTTGGKTTVTGGAILSIGVEGALGDAPLIPQSARLILNNGTLQTGTAMTLNANRGIAVGSGGGTIDTGTRAVSYAGIIADNGGPGSLTKIGAGTLTLTGNRNTFTGAANIYGGTVNFSGIQDLGLGTAINFGQGTNSGTLQYATVFPNPTDITTRAVTTTGTGGAIIDINGNDVSFATNAITGTGALTLTDTAAIKKTLTLGVANSYAGNTTISAGSTVKIGNVGAIPSGSGKGTATISGTLDLNNLSPTLNLLTGAGTITNTASGSAALTVDTANSSGGSSFSGALNNGSGTTSLIKSGANSLTLTGITSTYSGGTTVNGTGTLLVSDDRSLGTVPGAATAGSITIASGATFGTATNDVTISSNRGIAINGATAASINVATGKTLTYGGVIANAGATIGGLTKASSTGILYLTGSNTYAGDTTVLGGVLKIGNASAIPFGVGKGKLSVASANSGAVDLNGFNITVNGLTGAGSIRSNVAGNATITVGDANATSSFTGTIVNGNASAVVGVTKIGTGILTLSGTNTYTGGTAITGGTININSDSALGASSGNLTFNGSGAILQLAATIPTSTRNMVLTTDGTIDTGAFSLTTTGTLSGAGGLSKIGAGTLTLNGNNSYTGTTTVSVGTLALGGGAAIADTGAVSLDNTAGAVLQLNAAEMIGSLAGGGATGGSVSLQSFTLTTGGNNLDTSYAGVVSGIGGLTKTGTGILTLSGTNTFTGTTTVSAGTLALSGGAAIADTGAVLLADTVGAMLQLNAAETIGSLAGGGNSGGNVSLQGYTLTTGAGNSDTTYNGAISGTGGLTKTGTGTLTLGGSNPYSGPTTISTGTLAMGSVTGLSSNSSMTISSSGTLDVNGNSVSIGDVSGTGTITNNGPGAATLTAGASGSTTFSGAINDGTSTLALTKSGSGTLTLAGNNNYSAGTTLSGGTLRITGASALGASSGVLTFNGSGATLQLGATLSDTRNIVLITSGTLDTGTFNLTSSGAISGSGGLSKVGVGTLTLSGTNTYTGTTSVSAGALVLTGGAAIADISAVTLANVAGVSLRLDTNETIGSLAGGGALGGNVNLQSFTLTAGGDNTHTAYAGVISGTGGFTKTGAGTLTLSGANTYSGNTTIDAGGTLEIATATAIPSGSGKGNVIVNGTLDLDVSLTINGLSGTGSISTHTASGLMLTAGANEQSSEFAGNIVNGSGGGSLGLTKTGSGTLTLSGSNTYSGATLLNAGTLAIGNATGLSPNSTLTIAGPAFLDIHGFNAAMDGLLGTGTIKNDGATAATLTAGAAGGSTTFGGVIANGSMAIALTKSGTGTLTLTGINTYSGATTIENGTLSVANIAAGGNLGTGNAAITLGALSTKGTLSYTGATDLTYTRGFIVNAGGGEINTTAVGKTLTLQTGEIITDGTFTVSGSGNALVQSVISGSGGLTKANSGSMILSSVNTYSGDTTISYGTLQVTNLSAIPSGTGMGNVIANGTLDVNNLSLALNGLSGAGIVTNTAGSPVTLTLGGNDAAGNFTGIIQDGSGVTSLAKSGTGIQTLGGANTYSGDTTVSAGTLQLGTAAAIPSGSSKGNLALGGGGTLDLNDFDAAINGLTGSGLVTNHAGASTLSVGNNNQAGIFSGNIQDGLGTIGLTKTGTGTLTLFGTNTFSGNTLISQGTLSMGSDTGLSPASTLTIGNAGTLDINGKSIVIDGLAGTGTINNNAVGAVTLTTGASGGSGVFGGSLNNGSGVIALIKAGSGTQTLTAANGYSGGTTITGGMLAITADNNLGAIPGTTTAGNLVLNGGALSASNSFELNSKRGIAIGPDFGSGSGILAAALNQTLTYNGVIANNAGGSGGLTKTGDGTVTLGGVNTYSGDTTVSAGSLQIGNSAAIPSGTGKGDLYLNAALDLNNTSITVNGLWGTGTVSNTKSGVATLTVGDTNQTSAFAGLIENGNGTTALAKIGSGTLTLVGPNTYTGGTTIEAGTISVSNDLNLGGVPGAATTDSLVIHSGATLATTATFTLANNRGIAVGPGGAGSIDVFDATTLTYGGVIANHGGTGGFTKTGTGTLILTGTSTFTGATTVEQGVLTVNGSLAGSTSLAVKPGATLTGIGTTGAMTVDPSGTLSPGDGGIGTLRVAGSLTLGGIADFELGTPGASHAAPGVSDRVAVTGDVTFGGTLNLIDNANASGMGSVGAGSYKLITYTGTASGSFTGVTGLPAYHNALHDVAADQALYIDLYNYAVATVTPTVDLGRIHAGGSFGTRSLTVGNTAAAGAFTEALGGTFGTPTSGFTATGSVTGIEGGANNLTNLVVGISNNTAGVKSGSVAVNFTSQAVSGSGLDDTALDPQSVGITGFAYTGQSTWLAIGSGSWGNNANDFGRWDGAGGAPGLDGVLSAADTATFGTAIIAPATVSLEGASPSLKSVTFDSATPYTLAQGTGGTLTLHGSGGPATLTVAAGSHTVLAPVALGSDANLAITQAADTLTVSGTLSGAHGIAKTGAGTLLLAGANLYTGHTSVDAGVLALTGSLADSAVTVASGATLTGAGTIGDSSTKAASLSVLENGTHAPGNNGPGSQAINGTANYAARSIFAWDLKLDTPAVDPGAGATNQGTYDHVAVSGALTGTDATFQIALGGSFSDNFWNTAKHWDVFSSGAGSTDLKSIFTVFSGTDIAPTTGLVSGQGQFSFSGNTLNWSVVPEPTSTLVGLLIGAGLLRRQRKERAIFPPAGPPPVFQRCQHPR